MGLGIRFKIESSFAILEFIRGRVCCLIIFEFATPAETAFTELTIYFLFVKIEQIFA
jgi:hypothetical protein